MEAFFRGLQGQVIRRDVEDVTVLEDVKGETFLQLNLFIPSNMQTEGIPFKHCVEPLGLNEG